MVTINDIIVVDIQINTKAVSSEDNKVYDLTRGLTLYSYPLTNNWKNLVFENLSNGHYTIKFTVRNLKNIDEPLLLGLNTQFLFQ